MTEHTKDAPREIFMSCFKGGFFKGAVCSVTRSYPHDVRYVRADTAIKPRVPHNGVVVKSLLDAAFETLLPDAGEDEPTHPHLRVALARLFWGILGRTDTVESGEAPAWFSPDARLPEKRTFVIAVWPDDLRGSQAYYNDVGNWVLGCCRVEAPIAWTQVPAFDLTSFTAEAQA